jgi:hypothetical protein
MQCATNPVSLPSWYCVKDVPFPFTLCYYYVFIAFRERSLDTLELCQ